MSKKFSNTASVSHDRYFMDRLVDHMFVFEGDGMIRDFPGNYTQYRIWQKEQERKEAEERKIQAIDTAQIPSTVEEASTQKPKEKRKLSYKEQREFEQLEKDIPALEQEKAELAERMSSNIPYEELEQVNKRMIEITNALEEKEMRWLELSEWV